METLYPVLFGVLGLSFLFGVAALILWIRDRGGLIGKIINGVLGALMVALAALFLSGGLYDVFSSPQDFMSFGFTRKFFTIVWILLGIAGLWSVGRWIFGAGPGIEKQNIDFDAPELVESVKRARETLPYFIEQTRRHVDGAYIKFPFVTDHDVTEHIWAYVHHYQDGSFNVSIANEPYTQETEFETRREVPESEVEDWQIMRPDNRIEGAYSLIGAFQYLERTGVKLNRTMRKQKAQLAEEPCPGG